MQGLRKKIRRGVQAQATHAEAHRLEAVQGNLLNVYLCFMTGLFFAKSARLFVYNIVSVHALSLRYQPALQRPHPREAETQADLHLPGRHRAGGGDGRIRQTVPQDGREGKSQSPVSLI